MGRWRLGLSLCLVLACGEAPEPAEPEALLAGTPAERAMVRGLLDEIAATHGPATITDEAVRELWETRMEGRPLPARVPLEEVEDELRAELVRRARLAALVELVAELERREGVERNLPAIEALPTLPLTFEEER